jgi:hypothetical protein
MLTDVGSDDRLATSHLIQLLHDVLRHDDALLHPVFHALLGAPPFDLLPPVGQHLGIRAGIAGVEQSEHLLEHIRDIADDRHIDLDAFGDRRRIDVDVDDLARNGGKVVGIADHPVVKAGTDGQQHVAMLHGHVGFDGAMHARHTEELSVGSGISAKTHQRVGNRKAQAASQLGQLLGAIGKNDSATGVDHRSLGLQQQMYRLLDLSQMPLDHRVVRTHLDRLRILELALCRGDVLRNIDHHRTRTAAVGDVERLFDRHCQLVDVIDQEVVLHAGAGDSHRIALLEGILPDIGIRHLSRDHHQRHRIHIGRGNARHRIGRARTRGHQRHADLVRGARQTVGSMHCGLLVAHQNMLDLILFEQRIINVKNRPTRIAEYIFDLFFLQAPDYNLRTGHHRHCRRPSKQIARKKSATLKLWPRLVKAFTTTGTCGNGFLPDNSKDSRSGQPTRTVRFPHHAIERRAFKQAMFAVRNEESALDIVQDAMMKLAEKYGDRPQTELPMLFQRILQNTIRDYYRRSKVRSLWTTLLSRFHRAMTRTTIRSKRSGASPGPTARTPRMTNSSKRNSLR